MKNPINYKHVAVIGGFMGILFGGLAFALIDYFMDFSSGGYDSQRVGKFLHFALPAIFGAIYGAKVQAM